MKKSIFDISTVACLISLIAIGFLVAPINGKADDGDAQLNNRQTYHRAAGPWHFDITPSDASGVLSTHIQGYSRNGGQIDLTIPQPLSMPTILINGNNAVLYLLKEGGGTAGWGIYRVIVNKQQVDSYLPDARQFAILSAINGSIGFKVYYARTDGEQGEKTSSCNWAIEDKEPKCSNSR
jgi:hypothetical protein